ncbi:MAG: hypothetical protein IT458_02755 [Planctomycetes bacterium]|nr:hypothetical protein [Planctomycetota bacterium]
MILAFVVWVALVLHLYLLDGVLAAHVGVLLDAQILLGLYLALFVRPGWIPPLLVAAGLCRSVLVEGDTALHVLVLGIPVAALVPFRRVFARHHVLWNCVATILLGVALPRVGGLLVPLAPGAAAVPAPALADLLVLAVTMPLALAALRRLPPFRTFQERSE